MGGTSETILRRLGGYETGRTQKAGEATAPAFAVVKGAESEPDRFVLMVAYSANEMPLRGADGYVDLASPRALEKAAWRWALNGFRVGIGHKPGSEDAAQVVESFVHRAPDWVVKSPDGSTQTIRTGSWVVGMILSPEAWAAYKSGAIKGASPQGTARRKPASRKTLARVRS